MKTALLSLLMALVILPAAAQSKTTDALEKKFDNSMAFYFYKNTLRMLNQQENKEFDDLIRNIEKLKFLIIDKGEGRFAPSDYKKLISDYRAENYEAIVTSRMDGRNFDIYLNDAGHTPATVVLVNDSTSLFVLDMIGSLDVTKAGALFSAIDGSSEIGKKIKDFTEHKDTKKKGKGIHID